MVFELNNLEKDYKALAKKYALPSFHELNEDFEVDKIDRETRCLLRLLRKVIMEKIINSMNFLEMLLNPVNAPRVYLTYIRSMSSEDRKVIDSLYAMLGELSLQSLELEVDYAEKNEAQFIKKAFASWQKTKPGFRKILASAQHPNTLANKREKSYFG